MSSSKRTRWVLIGAAFAILVGVAIHAARGGSGDPDADQVLGFNEDPDPSAFGLQASLGMPVRRLPAPWNAVEPTPGGWDWAQSDAAYSALLAEDLQPLIVAVAAPCWARPALPCDPVTQAPPDPGFDAEWADYVRRLAQRYPAAIGIEIWNEPNLTVTFQPQVDPDRFTALLKQAHSAVEAVDPAMPVISGGLFASSESGPSGMADGAFLAGMYDAGASDAIDAIGAHPYPTTDGAPPRYDLASVELALDRVRAARDAAGDSSTPIWITEMGVLTQYATGSPPSGPEAQQAEDLIAMLQIVEDDPDVRVVLIHRLVDEPYDPLVGPIEGAAELAETGFGVFRSDGTPKPAACALSDEFGGTLDC